MISEAGANSVKANVRAANVKVRRVLCGGPAGAKSSLREIRRWLIGRELFDETK